MGMENAAKSCEDLQASEDKVEHLSKIKQKLEITLDELNDSLDREKRSRADTEKTRRKVEGELKVTQETVSDLQQQKEEHESTILRKEKELTVLSSKLDEDQGHVTKLQKGIKELQARVEELEEELEAERQARAKAERQRSDLARELESLGERLNEAGGATHAQVELNKKRDNEIGKLRKDLEEAHIQHETTLIGLKKKPQDAVAEMAEQIDTLSKMKAKIEKDKSQLMHEIQDVRAATEEIIRSKASAEKSTKNLVGTLNEVNKKVEEANLTLGDMDGAKRKLASDNADLLRQLQEIENAAALMAKYKVQLSAQLEEVRRVADDEAKERQSLLGKFKNLEHELDGHREHLDEELGAKEDICRQLVKANQESDFWRQKFETEGLARAEEIEMTTLKLQARLSECQNVIEQLQLKVAQIDKAKGKLQADIDTMAAQADAAHLLNSSMEKKAKQFDKIVGEWKLKVDSTSMDLDNAQKECRNASSELFRIKSAYEESVLQLDEVRKENKVLSNEIKDIMDQISEGGRSIHEIDKIRKRLEAEKMELQAALEEAEGALEQEENKVLRAQLELSQVRQEIERRIAEKDEEFQSTRKNFTKLLMVCKLHLNTPTLLMVKHKRPSRSTMAPSGMPKPSLKMNKEPRKLPGMDFWVMNARPTPPRMLLKRPALCSSNLTALAASLNKSSQTPMSNSQNSLAKTKLLLEPRGSLSLRCKHCIVIWTRCPVRLLTLRRRPRRQWLMLLVLLRNSVLNKTWLLDSRGNANSLNAKSRTAPPGWTMLRPMPSREARRP